MTYRRRQRQRRGHRPRILPRIFNAFEQAGRDITRQFGGLGLGLTISKAMVEMHGGRIPAHSQGKGKGATFTVRLPIAQVPLPVVEPGSADQPTSAPRGQVLVVSSES